MYIITKYRLDNKLSKKEMSKLLGISYHRYLNLENCMTELKLFEIIQVGIRLNLFYEISETFKELSQYNEFQTNDK